MQEPGLHLQNWKLTIKGLRMISLYYLDIFWFSLNPYFLNLDGLPGIINPIIVYLKCKFLRSLKPEGFYFSIQTIDKSKFHHAL